MENPMDTFKQVVRSRTRAEWRAWLLDQWNDAWGWIEDNGGSSFFIGMTVMLFLLLAFRLVAVIALIVLCAAGTAYYLAPESKASESDARDTGDIQH